MHLKELHIARALWGANSGKLEGHIVFSNPSGEVKLLLNEDVSQKLLAIVADGVVDSARSLATGLTAEVITAPVALESPE